MPSDDDLVYTEGVHFCGRRDMVTAQNPRPRREAGPNVFKPPRRSIRDCVVKNTTTLVQGHSGMAGAEDSDETKGEDEYVPGKSLTLLSCSNTTLQVSRVKVGLWGLWAEYVIWALRSCVMIAPQPACLRFACVFLVGGFILISKTLEDLLAVCWLAP